MAMPLEPVWQSTPKGKKGTQLNLPNGRGPIGSFILTLLMLKETELTGLFKCLESTLYAKYFDIHFVNQPQLTFLSGTNVVEYRSISIIKHQQHKK